MLDMAGPAARPEVHKATLVAGYEDE